MITMSYIVISSLDYVYTPMSTRPYACFHDHTLWGPHPGHLISLKSDINYNAYIHENIITNIHVIPLVRDSRAVSLIYAPAAY